MSRRTTTIGIGSFGNWIDRNEHLKQTYNRILTRQLPLTEDAVFIMTLFMLSQRYQGSRYFKAVRSSKNIGAYSQYFNFIPDMDLIEVRTDNSVIGYELKGLQKSKSKGMQSVNFYEGLDQALSYLINPTLSPLSDTLPAQASIFDYVYLVHPEREPVNERHRNAFSKLVQDCTPVGLIYVSHNRWREVVSAKPNPFLHLDLKSFYLQNLDAFEQYTKFKLSLVQ